METAPAPEFDNIQAFTEGWCIADVGFAFTSHVPFQLQGVCNPELNKEMPFEENDEGAWEFVVAKANGGSAYHQSAIEYLRKYSIEECADFTAKFPVTYPIAA